MKAFAPTAATVSITVGAASARVAIGSVDQVRVMNNGTATVWIAFGDGTVTTTAGAGMPVGPGVTEVLTVPYSLTSTAAPNVAAIAAGATGIIYFTPGTGL